MAEGAVTGPLPLTPGRRGPMSTAGKVLIVLVMLLMPVWILLVSAVAQLNKNGGQAVAALEKQYASLETQLRENKELARKTRDEHNLLTTTSGEETSVLRAKQGGLEAIRSTVLEDQSRKQVALGHMEAALKNAKLDQEHRINEKTQMIQEKSNLEAEVKQLMAVTAELTNQLEKLRNDFKSTYEQNKKRVAIRTPK
jgi:hypothetical protein